jgi:hypothetical protein
MARSSSNDFERSKTIHAADPADAQLLSNEAVALIKVGDVDAAMHRTASALANYRKRLRSVNSSAPPRRRMSTFVAIWKRR